MRKLNKEIIVFFHEGTLNGKAGAYAAWKIFQNSAHYEGVDYCTLENLHTYDVSGKTVYIIGLSIAMRNLDTLVYSADKVYFIDHHPGTKNIAESFDPSIRKKLEVIHSSNRASCCLAWSHFVDDQPVPQLFLAIEDMQVRQSNPTVPNSYFICMGLSVHFDFISLNTFFQNNLERLRNTESVAKLINDGHHYYKFIESLVNSYNNRAEYYDILDKQVPILNIPKTFVEGCLTILASKCGIALSYTDTGNKRYWSVRTLPESKLHAGKISELMEGGGSLYVGGFTTSTKILPDDLQELFKTRMTESVNSKKSIRITEQES